MRFLLCLLLVGCEPGVKRCKENTLFVSVTLEGASVNADQLFVDVSLDGGPAVHTELTHTPSKNMGGVEVDFPNGYPKGHAVAVTLTALVAGNPIASGSAQTTLTNSCEALTLVVSPGAVADLSEIDLTGADFSGSDLAAPPDLSEVDLIVLDLTVFPDLINCMPTPEACFDNADNDCDGLIDCADPDCTGGGSPVATCVPNPGAAEVGTLLNGTVACPADFPGLTALGSNFTAASCAIGTCTGPPTPNASRCAASLDSYGGDDSCVAASTVANLSTTTSCVSFTPIPDGTYHKVMGPFWTYANPPCTPTGGTATKTNAKFNANDTFCKRTIIGGGCNGLQICVPTSPPNHCVMLPGNQVTCPNNYNLRTTRYFTGLSDPVTCTCNSTKTSDGNCSDVSVGFYETTQCGGPATISGTCNNLDIETVRSGQMVGNPANLGTCTTGFDTNDTSAPTGEQTVCCTP